MPLLLFSTNVCWLDYFHYSHTAHVSLSQELRARAVQREDVTRRLNDFHPTTALRHVSDFVNTWVDKMANESVYGFREWSSIAII